MADRPNMTYKAGQAKGQAQMKKDEIAGKVSETAKQGTEDAGGFLQQTGEQMKQMAQSATEAVKNVVGMSGSSGGTTAATTDTTTTTTNKD